MNFLITGGAGFIGSNLAHALIKRGDSVRILDNFSTGRKANIEPIMDKIEVVEGDIRDNWTVAESMKDIDYVLHHAAMPSVIKTVQNPLTANAINITGMLNVLEAARHANVKRVVFACSSAIYGDSEILPKVETMKPEPMSPYAINKLTGEYYCQVYNQLYGLETVSLRYFNVFGPRQDPASQYSAVIPLFIKAVLSGNSPTIFGDGEQSRDFIYIDNVVSANLKACEAPLAPGGCFNIGGGKRLTLNETLKIISDIVGKEIKANYVDSRPGDIRHSGADISEAIDKLGFSVDYSFKDGLKETVNWFSNIFLSNTPVGGIKI
ncbi:MAG: SDR family oxidoreductase [candidate division Zixibacteria bacterium]|nr:SDR family oxidoreductase [candidate division Zixibacteria bacterium]